VPGSRPCCLRKSLASKEGGHLSQTVKAESFGLYHVIGLELLVFLKEKGGAESLVALGVETLAEYLLKAPGIPPETAAHYAEILL
jgi:hypothetical protein